MCDRTGIAYKSTIYTRRQYARRAGDFTAFDPRPKPVDTSLLGGREIRHYNPNNWGSYNPVTKVWTETTPYVWGGAWLGTPRLDGSLQTTPSSKPAAIYQHELDYHR